MKFQHALSIWIAIFMGACSDHNSPGSAGTGALNNRHCSAEAWLAITWARLPVLYSFIPERLCSQTNCGYNRQI